MGGQGTTATAREEPSAWAVSKANKGGVFSSNPIPSGMLVASWLVLTWAGANSGKKYLERLRGPLIG